MERKKKVVEMSPEEKEFKNLILRQMNGHEEQFRRQKEREEKWKRYLMAREALMNYLDHEAYESIYGVKTKDEAGAE